MIDAKRLNYRKPVEIYPEWHFAPKRIAYMDEYSLIFLLHFSRYENFSFILLPLSAVTSPMSEKNNI